MEEGVELVVLDKVVADASSAKKRKRKSKGGKWTEEENKKYLQIYERWQSQSKQVFSTINQ